MLLKEGCKKKDVKKTSLKVTQKFHKNCDKKTTTKSRKMAIRKDRKTAFFTKKQLQKVRK